MVGLMDTTNSLSIDLNAIARHINASNHVILGVHDENIAGRTNRDALGTIELGEFGVTAIPAKSYAAGSWGPRRAPITRATSRCSRRVSSPSDSGSRPTV